jgi:predicted RNA-binding protein with RPS1 domain
MTTSFKLRFGMFVDIGSKRDGLVHVKDISKDYFINNHQSVRILVLVYVLFAFYVTALRLSIDKEASFFFLSPVLQ